MEYHEMAKPSNRIERRPLASAQIRAARALLRWRAEDLAEASNLGIATIRRAELSEDQTSLTAANEDAIRRALESAGIDFLDENGGGAGVRFRKRKGQLL
jgi:transcriptional regulator with XRE-family HTH domain